jgi:hypothetical protein
MKRRSFIGLSSSIGLLASVLPASSLTASVNTEKNEREKIKLR